MELLDMLIICTIIAMTLLLAFLIPALIQIKKTTQKTEIFVERLSADLEPLLTNINAATTELQELSESLRSKIDKTDAILDSAQEASYVLVKMSSRLKHLSVPLISELGGILAGIQAFTNFFKISRKPERRYFDE